MFRRELAAPLDRLIGVEGATIGAFPRSWITPAERGSSDENTYVRVYGTDLGNRLANGLPLRVERRAEHNDVRLELRDGPEDFIGGRVAAEAIRPLALDLEVR